MIHEIPRPSVELRGLTKRFGKTTAVDHLNLTIPRGKIFGLIGPNGAGKSTTLKMLMGLLSISEGSASLLDMNVADHRNELRQRVGYVPETHHIYRWMKVRQVIWFTRSFYRKWNDQRAVQLMEFFGLEPDKKVKHLSRGMLVKLALLIAVCHEPELLILDEPMSGIDPLVREEFLDGVLRSICDHECTVVLSSHTLDDIQRIADSVGLLYEGRLLVDQPVDELLEKTRRIRAVLNDGRKPEWLPESAIWQRIQNREWFLTVQDYSPELLTMLQQKNPVGEIEVYDLSLEEVFKDYVKGRKGAA